jgi:hypothetical protein
LCHGFIVDINIVLVNIVYGFIIPQRSRGGLWP